MLSYFFREIRSYKALSPIAIFRHFLGTASSVDIAFKQFPNGYIKNNGLCVAKAGKCVLTFPIRI